MKVKFCLGIGFPSAMHKVEYDTEKDFGYTDEEWKNLKPEEIDAELQDFAWNYIELYIENDIER